MCNWTLRKKAKRKKIKQKKKLLENVMTKTVLNLAKDKKKCIFEKFSKPQGGKIQRKSCLGIILKLVRNKDNEKSLKAARE